MGRVMVQAARLRAHEDPLSNIRRLPLQKLPRDLMPSSVHLEVLVALKPLAADLTYIAIGF